MILIRFKNFITYQVYNQEKNKIYISCNIEINKKLVIKENKFISALNKKSNIQKLFNIEKLFIECFTKFSIIFNDENENFNFLFNRLALKTVKSLKQSKKKNQF